MWKLNNERKVIMRRWRRVFKIKGIDKVNWRMDMYVLKIRWKLVCIEYGGKGKSVRGFGLEMLYWDFG